MFADSLIARHDYTSIYIMPTFDYVSLFPLMYYNNKYVKLIFKVHIYYSYWALYPIYYNQWNLRAIHNESCVKTDSNF